MATLHLVHQSPTRADALTACLAVLMPGDGLLLLEDGVFAALESALDTSPEGVKLFVLDADVQARGLESRISAHFRRVDYAGFVEACVDHDRVVTWT